MNNRKNILSAHVIADYFLLRTQEGDVDVMTTVKIQKLLYYAQAWCLAERGAPLFEEKIEAWARGPVCKEIYDRFKTKAIHGIIDVSETTTVPLEELQDEDINLLDKVWDRYSGLSSNQLVLLTHQEKPWQDAYGETPMGKKCDEVIPQEAMKSYFQGLNMPHSL